VSFLLVEFWALRVRLELFLIIGGERVGGQSCLYGLDLADLAGFWQALGMASLMDYLMF